MAMTIKYAVYLAKLSDADLRAVLASAHAQGNCSAVAQCEAEMRSRGMLPMRTGK